jgi:hypothetical protein
MNSVVFGESVAPPPAKTQPYLHRVKTPRVQRAGPRMRTADVFDGEASLALVQNRKPPPFIVQTYDDGRSSVHRAVSNV